LEGCSETELQQMTQEDRPMNVHSNLMRGHMLIGGELVASEAGEWLESVNPANEETLGHVPAATAADINRAVTAAEAAQPAWAAMEPKARAKLMRQLAAKLREHTDNILRIEVIDTGNTISKMRADVASAGDTLDYYAGFHSEIKGETIPASAKNLHMTLREPYGVVGRIIPFNHPIKFAANALAAPLMAGNTVVLKPPETSPLSATMLGEICREVLPAGVVNIVTGLGMPAGDALARHPAVKRIAFTGSVPTGRAIQRAAAEGGIKHVTLELGGKNPLIAFPDMDPDKVAQIAVAGMNFAWQGQSCGSTSRLLLHESLYEGVLKRVVERVAALRLGDPLDDKSQMGPINSKRHYERVCAMVESGRQEGARLRTGSLGVQLARREGGADPGQLHRIRPHGIDLHQRSRRRLPGRARGQVRLCVDQRRIGPFLRDAIRRLQEQRPRARGGYRRIVELHRDQDHPFDARRRSREGLTPGSPDSGRAQAHKWATILQAAKPMLPSSAAVLPD
jgi:betaine-aldehyde dehydrogenase